MSDMEQDPSPGEAEKAVLLKLRRILHTGTSENSYLATLDPCPVTERKMVLNITGATFIQDLIRLQLGCKAAQIIKEVSQTRSSPTRLAVLRVLALLAKVQEPEIVSKHARNVILDVILPSEGVDLLYFYEFFIGQDSTYIKGS